MRLSRLSPPVHLWGPRSLPLAAMASLAFTASVAHAGPPNGPELLRALGPRAQRMLEPGRRNIGAVVRVPQTFDLASLGLRPLSPGFARLRGTVDEVLAFADAHPDLPLEVAPPPHLLLNNVGLWTHATAARAEYGISGKNVLVGVADTGVDFTLADFTDPKTGLTRVAWLIDFTAPCAGLYPALEQEFGDCATGGENLGAVYAGSDLMGILGSGQLPTDGSLTDNVGHGTHVTSIA
ncbi:MAG: hypothetical protein ACLQVI_13095, partial [Polyangiaceae bacterium]